MSILSRRAFVGSVAGLGLVAGCGRLQGLTSTIGHCFPRRFIAKPEAQSTRPWCR